MSGLFSSDSKASAPSKITDTRAVAYDDGLNITGNKNKVFSNRDQASQFAGAGQSNIAGDGNTTSFNVLDGGAITQAFDFARATQDAAVSQFEKIFQTGGSLVEQGADMNDTDKQNRKTLMIGAGVVIALVALWILNK